MKEETRKPIDRLLALWKPIIDKANDIQAHNNTVVIIVCLLVSTLFWFLKALNDEYQTEVEFPIDFVDIPKNYSIYGDTPEEIVATIEDDGFAIIRYRFSYVFSSIKIDVSNFFKDKQHEEQNGVFTLSQAELKKGLEKEIFATSNIISVYPEKVSVSFSRLEEKKLPIKVLAEISTEQQHIVNGNIRTSPDSVLVIGNGVQLAKTEAILTNPIRANNLEDTLVRNVTLQAVDGLVFDKKRVKLTIPVETFTEKVVEVPIQERNFPDSLSIRTFPGVAKVSCICGLSVYNQVHPYDFICYIDYANVKDRSIGQVEIKVENKSEYAQRVKMQTPVVDYLIEKEN